MSHLIKSRKMTDAVKNTAWVFFLVLFAVKPFIDLMWDVQLGSVSGLKINPPRVTGLLVFASTLLWLVTLRRTETVVAAQGLVLVFLGWFTISMGYAYANDTIRLSDVANTLLRAYDAYLLYVLFSYLWSDRRQVQTFVFVVWLSTLAVNIVSLLVWRTGEFNTNVTGTVERFAGLYNDAGGPSYNAAICFAFCILQRDLAKRFGTRIYFEKLLYVLTIIVCTLLLSLSLTKSAFGIVFLFCFLWWGVYKKMSWLVLPLLPAAALLMYTESASVQTRFSNEVRVFVEGDYSERALNSLGTGRYAVWSRLIKHYDKLPFGNKLIGIGKHHGAHNQYLAYLMKIGAIGAGLFIAMIAYLLHFSWLRYRQTLRPEVFFGFALLSIFCFLGIVGHPFDWTTLFWYVLIMLSTANARYSHATVGEEEYADANAWEPETAV